MNGFIKFTNAMIASVTAAALVAPLITTPTASAQYQQKRQPQQQWDDAERDDPFESDWQQCQQQQRMRGHDSSAFDRSFSKQIEGQIEEIRTVRLPGQDRSWVIAGIQTPQGKTTTVLLGPEDRLRQLNLQQGDRISVQSTIAAVHGQGVFAARRIQSNGQSVSFAGGYEQEGRPLMRFIEGQLTDKRTVRLPGQDRSWIVAAVRTPEGQAATVLLGPEERLEQLDLQQGDYVSVEGIVAGATGRGIIAAQRIQSNGQFVTLGPSPMGQQQQEQEQFYGYAGEQGMFEPRQQMDEPSFEGQARPMQLQGQISELRTVRLPGQERSLLVAAIEMPQGRTTTLVLGPHDRVQQLELQQGDYVSAQCTPAAMYGRGVFTAKRIHSGGKSINLAGGFEQQARPMTRYIEGQVSDVRTVRLPGQDRSWVVAGIRTPEGQTTSVLLGPEERLQQLDLQRGDFIAVQGVQASPHNRNVIAAYRVQSNGQFLTLGPGFQQMEQDQYYGYAGEEMFQEPQMRERFGERPMGQRIQGQITELRTVRLPGQDQAFFIGAVETSEGRTVTVLFGPQERLDQLNLQEGDYVNVYGLLAPGHGRGVYAAQRIAANGQTVTLGRSPQMGM